MKRVFAGVLAAVLLLSLLPTGVSAADLRSAPFGRVVYVGGETMNYTDELTALIAQYQCSVPEVTRLTETEISSITAPLPELLIYAPENASASAETVRRLAALVASDGVFAVCGLGYRTDLPIEEYAKGQVALRHAAENAAAVYFDAYAAMGGAPWSVEADGKTPSTAGKQLLANGLFAALARECTCLAAEHSAPLDMDETPKPPPEAAMLTAFAEARDAAAMRAVLESRKTALPLTAYTTMQAAERAAFLELLTAADRSDVDSREAAEELYWTVLLRLQRQAPRRSVLKNGVLRYVAAGDSISCGATAVYRENGWVPTLARLLGKISGQKVRLVNKAVSGSRMCLKTTWADYPPAKDTVQDYSVPNHPDLLTAAFGINDLRANVPLETFLAAYRGYVREVQAGCPETVIVLVGMIPMGDDFRTEEIIAWNAAIRAMAEELGVWYADPFDDLYGTQWLLTDNLHPCDVGYRVQAGAVLRTLCAAMDFSAAVTLPWENPFRDVTETDWFYAGVKAVTRLSLFRGVTTERFAPEATMTRGMLVTVLWRMDGKPAAGESGFSDVVRGAYYAEAVAWAAEKGIVNGIGGGRFDPEGNVTREQLAAIFFRYAQLRGADTKKRADLSAFPDGDKVSAYAMDALGWANAVGLVNGIAEGGTAYLRPQNTAARAQAATILARYLDKSAQ